MKMRTLALLIIFWLPVVSFGQTSDIDSSVVNSAQLQVLRSQRGDIFFGQTRALSPDSVFFNSRENILLSFSRNEVVWLGKIEDAKWLISNDETSLNTRYAFQKYGIQGHENLAYSPTAFSLPKGRVAYRNVDLIFNLLDVGITDHFTIGGGFLIPEFLILRGKVTAKANDKIRLGAGLTSLIGVSAFNEGVVSHFFGIATFGSPKYHFNLTLGPAFQWGYPEAPLIVTLGGGLSIAKNWRIYTDIGFTPAGEGVIPTMLVSWFNKRNRLEFGLASAIDDIDFATLVPLIGYAHRF